MSVGGDGEKVDDHVYQPFPLEDGRTFVIETAQAFPGDGQLARDERTRI